MEEGIITLIVLSCFGFSVSKLVTNIGTHLRWIHESKHFFVMPLKKSIAIGDLVLYSHRSELEWRSTSWHRKGRSWTLGHRMISSKKSRTLKQFNNMWRSVKKICFGFPNFNYKFMKRQKSCATWCKKMSNLKNHIIGGTFVPKGIIMMPIYIMTPPLWANLQATPWPLAHHHTCHPSFQCMMA